MKKRCSILFFLGLFFQTQAQLPPDFFEEKVGGPMAQMAGITFDPNGRGYCWFRDGKVLLLDTSGQFLPAPLLDITDEVANWWDVGMLGFVLDPDFLQNGYFYVLFVVDRHYWLYHGTPDYDPAATILNQATFGRLARFQADAATGFTTIVPGSRKMLLGETPQTGIPLLYKTHGPGHLVFGSDGSLLVACGDSGFPEYHEGQSDPNTYFQQALDDGIIRPAENIGPFRAQLPNTLNGKLLRLDPATGDGLPGNPFFDSATPRSPRSRLWALGLRNPYRFVLVPNTGSHLPGSNDPGHFLVGDVGFNGWEELNVVTAPGQNFGWPLYEGMVPDQTFLGMDMRNQDAPNPLDCGSPFFKFEDLLAPASKHPAASLLRNPCDTAQAIPALIPVFSHRQPALAYRNAIDQQPDPQVFITKKDDAGNPVPVRINDPDAAVAGSEFEGICSIGGLFYQGTGFPEEYRGRYFHLDFQGWIKIFDFDENDELTQIEDFHASAKDAICLAENPRDGCIYYVDFKGKQLNRICYGGSPAPLAVATATPRFGASPLTVQFDASGSVAPVGGPLAYFWDFGNGQTSTEPQPVQAFNAAAGQPTAFLVKLTVTDTTGKSKTAQTIVSLNNTPPTVKIRGLENGSFYALQGAYASVYGEAEDLEHAASSLQWDWQVFLHHDTHEHSYQASDRQSLLVELEPVGCTGDNYHYRFELRATDPAGLSGTDVVEVFPWCGEPFFEMADLYGRATDRSIEIWWEMLLDQTANIEVERSADGVFFEKIGAVPAGQPSGERYLFTDHEPILGNNYYQLRFRNPAGAFGFSNPVRIAFPAEADFDIQPNPVHTGGCTVRVRRSESNLLTVNVFSTTGSLVASQQFVAEPLLPFEGSLDLGTLAAGLYFFELRGNGKVQVRKVVVRQ